MGYYQVKLRRPNRYRRCATATLTSKSQWRKRDPSDEPLSSLSTSFISGHAWNIRAAVLKCAVVVHLNPDHHRFLAKEQGTH